MYRVGSFIDFDTDYGTPSMYQYFQSEEAKANKPDMDAGLGCHCLLLALFSKVSSTLSQSHHAILNIK